ncbi:hypothetical protein M0657_001106 [Pyricularia oryzae]|nr:hypothetical protein M9X92_000233 [Pyricularia oryzae]KAI7931608.1 hypothetical protein M0657_001106 [Pyricularia oryzae]
MSLEPAVPPNREQLAEDLIENLPINRTRDPSAAASLLISVRKHIKSISQQQPHHSLYGDLDLDRLGTNL